MDTDELKIVRLEGGPRARGRMHGEHFRPRIAELMERWGDSLEQGYGVDRRRYVDLFFEATAYETTTARLAPEVLEEVSGIAEGSGADPRALLAFQHVNEEFEWAPLFARQAPAKDGEACSTIVVPPAPGRPSRIAQNLDLAQFLDGFQVLLRCPTANGEGEVMALSVPGMISLMGMNSHGFAVCDNTLTQLRTDPEGLPIYAIYRQLLESRTLAEAIARVDRTPHAVGLNWVMGDPDGVAMIERSAGVSTPYRPGRAAYHTNHPLVCEDWAETRGRPSRSSYLRHAALHQRLQGLDAPGAEDLRAVLASRDDADYPVSRGGGVNLDDQQIGFTLACNIFELRRGDPRWRIASGPPHETIFREFGFD